MHMHHALKQYTFHFMNHAFNTCFFYKNIINSTCHFLNNLHNLTHSKIIFMFHYNHSFPKLPTITHSNSIHLNSTYHIHTSKHHHNFNILKSTQIIQNSSLSTYSWFKFVKQYIFCNSSYMKIILLSE
jgi:hypothetical protein